MKENTWDEFFENDKAPVEKKPKADLEPRTSDYERCFSQYPQFTCHSVPHSCTVDYGRQNNAMKTQKERNEEPTL